MKVREKNWIRFRVYVVAFLFLAGMAAVMGRAYQLQVLDRKRLDSIARAGYRGTIKLPPKRGTIYDREGHELAVSVEVASIYAHPNQIADKPQTARALATALNLKPDAVQDLLESKKTFVWISRKISPDKARQVQALRLEGVGTTPESRRYYPGKEIAAHVIGFAGEDNQGLEGIEKKFDHLMKGPDYTLIQMRDALRRPFYISGPMTAGEEMHHLVLTIDKDIQYKAEQIVKEMVDRTKAKSGHCVIVNPRTGEILAMAIAPLFNPNIFDKLKPAQWRNQVITDCFEPGSTMKTFVMAAALDRGISPQSTFFCENGAYTIGPSTIHEHDNKKYGSLTLTEIIAVSSNIGAAKVGQRVGYKKLHEYLKNFGFGEKSGIDLAGEREGFVRSPKDIREIEKATTCFGQGVTVTSLQLVMAMSAIANQGVLMKPLIVKAVKDQQGRTVTEFQPQPVRRVISQEAAQKACQILEIVVSDKGTAKVAAIGGYRVAGKTGTAQKVDPRTRTYSRRAHMGLFAGFVPSDDARLAMVVVVDEPEGSYYGGVVAAPVFRQVGAWTLSHLRVNPQVTVAAVAYPPLAPDEPKTEASPLVQTAENAGGMLPNFRGMTMRQVIKEGRSLGIRVAVEGSGLAVGQVPEPGAPLEQVAAVKVSFMPQL